MEKIFFKNGSNQNICGILHEPNRSSGKIVLFIHGFSSNKDSSPRILAKLLEKQGMNSFRIDLDDRGESEPHFPDSSPSEYKQTVLDAACFLRERGYTDIHIVGTSFGGLVTLLAAQEEKFSSLFLRCPGSGRYRDGFKRYEGFNFWTYTTGSGENIKMGMRWIEELKNISMTGLARGVTVPTRIIHGTKDSIVYFSWSEDMVKENPKIDLVPIPNAGHGLDVNGDYSLSQKAFIEWFEQFK